ncbi:MAG: hypothetical protein FWB71_03080 [Defluviitaleaceae bacterium]|nr:hypothetical protein [Defluviitaleaceae bacterium]
MLTLNYDKKYDVLYLGVADNSNSYGAEESNNMNVFRDVDSDCITGFVIFGFMDKYNGRSLPPINEPFAIDYEKDVMPQIV